MIRLRPSLGWLVMAACTPVVTRADSFEDFNGPLPDDFVATSETVGGEVSATFSASTGGGVLTLSDPTSKADGGANHAWAHSSEVFLTDVRVKATINPERKTTGGAMVLWARGGDDSSYFGGFYQNNQGISDQGFILLGKCVGDDCDFTGGAPWLTNDYVPFLEPYVLEFEVIDRVNSRGTPHVELTATLFSVDGANELLSATFRDTGFGGPIIHSGTAGVTADLQGYSSQLSLHGTFDNLQVVAIPEPSAIILAAIGLVGLLAFGWRKPGRAAC